MDEQHKRLVESLNQLHAAMAVGQGKTVTGDLLGKLVQYTRDHFTAEEALMRRTGYSKLAEHGGLHKNLTHQVEQFVHRFEIGELALNADLLTFLRDWLTTHILKEDREYGPWLNQHGVV